MKQLDLLFCFLYPNCCGICEKINEDGLCKKCELKLKQFQKYKVEQYDNKFFKSHTYLFPYKGIIRDKLIEYKFQNKSYLARMFGTLIRNETCLMKTIKSYDYIIPIPIHQERIRKRGYNQSELILKYTIYEKYKINTKILKKEINNLPQSTLNKEKRKENVQGVYKIKKEMQNKINKKSILLFDDIYTTGNTVNECSKILKRSGAFKIDVLTIAKD